MSNPSSINTAPLDSRGYGGHLAARLLEFTADTTPWQRRLWGLGKGDDEIHEADQRLSQVADQTGDSKALR